MTLARLRKWLLWFCATATFVWLVLLVPTLLWWKESLVWIVIMSWWANVAASGAFWWAIVTYKAVDAMSASTQDT